jgi:hypothetical protein
MKLVSVNTGLPREVTWHGRGVITAIYKEPVEGLVALRKLNLETVRRTSASTGDSIRRSTVTHSNTTLTGSESYLPESSL